jgi:hypothetical protein
MRLPRMTTRRWMILVAVVGMALDLWVLLQRRTERFTRIAEYHESHDPYLRPRFSWYIPPFEVWHHQMALKYRRAADEPWLPVAPDPPEPN